MFIFVDDGSTDGTARVLKTLANAASNFRLISLQKNRGKAEAVRQGVLSGIASGAEYVGYWDADLATPLSAILDFVDQFRQQPGLLLVMGSRVRLLGRTVVRKAYRHYLGRVFATFASIVLRLPVYDTQCGAKLFMNCKPLALAFKDPFISRWVFDVEIIARLLRGAGISGQTAICEYPLTEWRDVRGSKIGLTDFCVAALDLARIGLQYRK
jgi:glycosyltransferase involved in cell wall biosynthesis